MSAKQGAGRRDAESGLASCTVLQVWGGERHSSTRGRGVLSSIERGLFTKYREGVRLVGGWSSKFGSHAITLPYLHHPHDSGPIQGAQSPPLLRAPCGGVHIHLPRILCSSAYTMPDLSSVVPAPRFATTMRVALPTHSKSV